VPTCPRHLSSQIVFVGWRNHGLARSAVYRCTPVSGSEHDYTPLPGAEHELSIGRLTARPGWLFPLFGFLCVACLVLLVLGLTQHAWGVNVTRVRATRVSELDVMFSISHAGSQAAFATCNVSVAGPGGITGSGSESVSSLPNRSYVLGVDLRGTSSRYTASAVAKTNVRVSCT